jgi:hypothetical protein
MNGMLVLNVDGTFAYRPNAGFTGADIFIYVLFEDERLRANAATGTQAVWHRCDRTIQHWPSIQARTLKLLPG